VILQVAPHALHLGSAFWTKFWVNRPPSQHQRPPFHPCGLEWLWKLQLRFLLWLGIELAQRIGKPSGMGHSMLFASGDVLDPVGKKVNGVRPDFRAGTRRQVGDLSGDLPI
jgi:hypothetical protein